MQAERALAMAQQTAPDPERASHLASLLIAIEVLGHVQPQPQT
jgi:hypothetical protein